MPTARCKTLLGKAGVTVLLCRPLVRRRRPRPLGRRRRPCCRSGTGRGPRRRRRRRPSRRRTWWRWWGWRRGWRRHCLAKEWRATRATKGWRTCLICSTWSEVVPHHTTRGVSPFEPTMLRRAWCTVATVRLVMEAPRLVRDCATPTSPLEPQFVAKHGPRGGVRGRFGERFELVVRCSAPSVAGVVYVVVGSF